MELSRRSGLDRTLSLVRHGQSTWNRDGRVPGQGDPPLTALGVDQARAAGRQLRGTAARWLLSSDLARARTTAAHVAASVGLEVELDPDLREQSVGGLTGRRHSTLHATEPPPGLHLHEVRWGGGESVCDVYARLERFFDRLRTRPPGHAILVSHAMTIQIALAYLAGRSAYDVEWQTLPHGGVVTITPDG